LPVRGPQGRRGEGAGVALEDRQGPARADDGSVRPVRGQGKARRRAEGRRGGRPRRRPEEHPPALRPPLPGAVSRGDRGRETGAGAPDEGSGRTPDRALHVGRGPGRSYEAIAIDREVTASPTTRRDTHPLDDGPQRFGLLQEG